MLDNNAKASVINNIIFGYAVVGAQHFRHPFLSDILWRRINGDYGYVESELSEAISYELENSSDAEDEVKELIMQHGMLENELEVELLFEYCDALANFVVAIVTPVCPRRYLNYDKYYKDENNNSYRVCSTCTSEGECSDCNDLMYTTYISDRELFTNVAQELYSRIFEIRDILSLNYHTSPLLDKLNEFINKI